MTSRTFKTALNLEARTAALFVQNANKFQSRITLRQGNMEINCKSIMGVVSMAIYEGQELVLAANGPDEAEAIEALAKMLSEV